MSTAWEAAMNDADQPHVYPLDDWRPHFIDEPCWCSPFDDEGITVHNSMDGRERYERGRKAS